MIMFSVAKIADWFLSQEPMTPKKIQKMVYYAYAWALTIMNNSVDNLQFRLFDDPIEAWVHGPAIRKLYDRYSNYGYNKIDQSEINNGQSIKTINKNMDILDILQQVYEVYGSYNANELESITHQEYPWQHAREGLSPIEPSHNIICDRDIFIYYDAR